MNNDLSQFDETPLEEAERLLKESNKPKKRRRRRKSESPKQGDREPPRAPSSNDNKKSSKEKPDSKTESSLSERVAKSRLGRSLKPYYNKLSGAYNENIKPYLDTAWRAAKYTGIPWLSRKFGKAAKWGGEKYWDFVKNSVITKDPKTNDYAISKTGTLKAITGSVAIALATWFAVIPAMRFGTYTAWQGTMNVATQQDEYVYTHGSSTVEDGYSYAVKATQSIGGEGTTFQIVKDPSKWIWYPEDLNSEIPQDTAFTWIDYSGYRLKLLVTETYPEIKDVLSYSLSSLPGDHPAHTGQAITHQDMRDYILRRLPVTHPAHQGEELSKKDLETYMLQKPLTAEQVPAETTPAL